MKKRRYGGRRMLPSATLGKIGKWLMRRGALSVVIADDEDVYFNPQMISAAESAGFCKIKRVKEIDWKLMKSWLQAPPDIIVLDVVGVCKEEVAKDGLALASTLRKQTPSMIVITSAHTSHMRSEMREVDYIIDNRLLTISEFLDELETIINLYLSEKVKFYKKLGFRAGMMLARGVFQIS